MDNTQQFVDKINNDQKKQEHNRKSGQGSPSNRLSTKQHSTNK